MKLNGTELALLIVLVLMLMLVQSCNQGMKDGLLPAGSETHNILGGYRAACGELPGLQGDDC